MITSDHEGELIQGVDRHVVPFTAKANHKKMQQLALALENCKKQKYFDSVISFNKIPGIDFYFSGNVCLSEKIKKEKSAWIKLLPRYNSTIYCGHFFWR
ncbi:MAG: UDP-glucose:(heptosyl)LPS alpha-1,3-glucosyltransferase [Pseudohongiellaceae bacterium]